MEENINFVQSNEVEEMYFRIGWYGFTPSLGLMLKLSVLPRANHGMMRLSKDIHESCVLKMRAVSELITQANCKVLLFLERFITIEGTHYSTFQHPYPRTKNQFKTIQLLIPSQDFYHHCRKLQLFRSLFFAFAENYT